VVVVSVGVDGRGSSWGPAAAGGGDGSDGARPWPARSKGVVVVVPMDTATAASAGAIEVVVSGANVWEAVCGAAAGGLPRRRAMAQSA
jgi:hypothetical protein